MTFKMLLFRNILGFCGDEIVSFPSTLARDLICKGHRGDSLLRDEIYTQLCKHLTQNPSTTSTFRAWKLLKLCLETFPPSMGFAPRLQHFLLTTLENTTPWEVIDQSLTILASLLISPVSCLFSPWLPTRYRP